MRTIIKIGVSFFLVAILLGNIAADSKVRNVEENPKIKKIKTILKEAGYEFSVKRISEKKMNNMQIKDGRILTVDEFMKEFNAMEAKSYTGVSSLYCNTETYTFEINCDWTNSGTFSRTLATFDYITGWGGTGHICTTKYDFPENSLYKRFFDIDDDGWILLNEDPETGCPWMEDPYKVSVAQRYQTFIQGQDVIWMYVPGDPFGWWYSFVFDVGSETFAITDNCLATPNVINLCD